MSQVKGRHLFPGGNTSLGFFSFYSNIITQEEADRIFIIKGGPGVGKSTFMKRMGDKMQEQGYEVEYLHCSSDNNSLDGIRIPALRIAFIDGTAPHLVDPKSPGAVDEILNFGAFWKEEGIRAHKDEIITTNKEIGYIFKRAYKYLKSAQTIYEANAVVYGEALKKGELNRITANWMSELFDGAAVSNEEGKQRSLFVSALTPNGLCNYLDSVLTTDKVYEIKGGLGTGEDSVLEKIKTAAVERGYDVEAYYCALNPFKLDHLVIPGLNAAFTTANSYHCSKVKKFVSVDMQQYMDKGLLDHYKEDMKQNKKEFDKLLNTALLTIKRAKTLHDQLENYYVPHIRFEQIDKVFDETWHRIIKT